MEQQSVAVGESDAGIGAATTNEERFTEVSIQGEPRIGQKPPILRPEEQQLVPNTPSELQPDKDGNPPKITPELIRKLRGRYFTIRHSRLEACGHRFDLVNEPRNNCDLCWVNFFAYHPDLVETADKFYIAHGKEPLIAMRGKKFFRYFTMYMSTLYHEQKEKEKHEHNHQEGTLGDGTICTESTVGPDASPSPAIEG